VLFAERVATLTWLAKEHPARLGLQANQIAVLHGGLPDVEQERIVDDFKTKASSVRLLITGDVASEGVNLHAQCHHLIHIDICWSLIRIEQRNGRIDRYVRRRESEVSGWPDFATVSADKLVMIEVKTEPVSHRPGQLAHYADLAAHHHPTLERRLIYVTPRLSTSAVMDAIEFQHVYWTEVSRAISEIWSTAPDDERGLAEYLVDFLGALATPWKHPYLNEQARKPRTPAPSYDVSLDETVLPSTDLHDVAAAVENDGKQRAVNISWANPDDMERVRLDLRNQLIAAGSSVRPWTWRAATSGGTALTPTGAELGYELRLSRYKALPSDGA
jgi:hypothetical protein